MGSSVKIQVASLKVQTVPRMKQVFGSAIWCLCAVAATANDGVYWGSGGMLYPVKESRIEMRREVLSFTCRGDDADVNVMFEFFNPDQELRRLTVGFQVPSATGDAISASEPHIKELRIENDGRLLPYRLMMASAEDAPLVEMGKLSFTPEDPGVFVFLFEMTFKPGLNEVQHSYSFRPGGTVMGDLDYSYILTTGAKWAGGRIPDFSFEVDMGSNSRFEVADVFGPNAQWMVVGTGKVESSVAAWVDAPSQRFVRVIKGKLLVTAKDLVPTENINVVGVPSMLYLGFAGDDARYGEHVVHAWRWKSKASLETTLMTNADLRLLRNLLFAQYGYVFKDARVRELFNSFEWYMPDPNMIWSDALLTPEERLFLGMIKVKESE